MSKVSLIFKLCVVLVLLDCLTVQAAEEATGFGKIKGFFSSITKPISERLKGESSESSEESQNSDKVDAVEDSSQPESALSGANLIKALQSELDRIGLDPGPADGIQGAKTANAIRLYQAMNGLPTDGTPSIDLLYMIRSGYGVVVDAHEYEGALRSEDETCMVLVDPFKMTDNAVSVALNIGGKIGKVISKSLDDSSDSTESELQSKLEEAKREAKRLNWMPIAVEQAYADRIHEKRLAEIADIIPQNSKGKSKKLYRKANDILSKILSEVEMDHPYSFNLFLIGQGTINAQAIPGGYIYVDTGVIDSGFSELIIAHEVAHVLKRHQTRELQARLIDSVDSVSDLKRLMGDSDTDPENISKRVLLLRGSFINFSKQQELQADACAIRMISEIPSVVVSEQIDRFVATLSKEKPGEEKPGEEKPELFKLSTHPEYDERKKQMQRVDALSKESKTVQR